jgi:hypothetical protein
MDPDPDPGAPKTRGSGGFESGSATLLDTVFGNSLRLRAFEEHFFK